MSGFSVNAPPVTVSGTLFTTTSLTPADVQVSSVHHALGASPGMAVLNVPLTSMSGLPDTANRTVQIDLSGTRIFSGTILRVSFNESGHTTQSNLYAVDDRAFIMRRNIGDPDNDDWGNIGYNVIFNRGGKGDRLMDGFSRYDPAASWWTIGHILSYVGKYYVEKFSDMSWPDNEWDNVPRTNENPGELSLGGMTVADAIDTLCQLLGNTTWAVDYTSGKLFPVRLDAMPQSVNIRYMVGPGDVDMWTASQIDVNLDGTRGTNRVVAISGSQQTEAVWSTDDNTLKERRGNAASLYPKIFHPDPSRTDPELGPVLAVGSWGRPWTPEGVTDAISMGPLKLEDRERLWIKHKDTDKPGEWRLAIDGFEFLYDPPAIQFLGSVTYLKDETRSSQTPETGEIVLKWDDKFDVRMVMTTLTDIHQKAERGYSKTFRYDFTTYLEQQQLIPQYALDSIGQDLTDIKGWIKDHESTLQAIADNYAQQSRRTHRELVAYLPYPQPLYLGVEIRMVRSDGGTPPIEPGSDPLICTGLDWYFEEQQELVIRAENTLGSAFVGQRPVIEDNEVISRWKNSRMGGSLGRIDSPRGWRNARMGGPARMNRRFGVMEK